MQFSSIVLTLFAAAVNIQASPLAERQIPGGPNADCCGCDFNNKSHVCTVPPPGGCFTATVICPFNPNPETEEMCCCCDPSIPAMRCKPVAKNQCFCPAVACPFSWDPIFLPANSQVSASS
ncbi:hypothetical protein CcaCcLH18_14288 [Colletotrichum camelliae]|nr:hypothetical protein CcaCcLH18_14288 [Colletotrichum camelliae]